MKRRHRLLSLAALTALTTAGCAAADAPAPDDPDFASGLALAASTAGVSSLSVTRDHITGDVYHYSAEIIVGPQPGDRVRIHRVVRELAPFIPVPTVHAVMLLHGDFATFETNFALTALSAAAAPDHALAVFLAERGVDVWGVDRRWTLVGGDAGDAELAGLAGQGYAVDIADTRAAMLVARLTRAVTDHDGGPIALGGFSRGAHLAYAYAIDEAARPASERHADALIPVDIYYRAAPEDEALRLATCSWHADDLALIGAGVHESPNDFIIAVGELAAAAPDEPSPLIPDLTNRDAFLLIAAQTFVVFPLTPTYHLAGGTFSGDQPTGLGFTSLALAADWFALAPPFQSLAESADTDAVWCGDGPQPVAGDLSDIELPVLYVGAAGGVGEFGRHTTEQLGSADVTVHIVRRLAVGDEAADYGHGDLLYGDDAPALAWTTIADWLLAH